LFREGKGLKIRCADFKLGSFAADVRFGLDAPALYGAWDGQWAHGSKSRETPGGRLKGGGGLFWSWGACFVWGVGRAMGA
jgi:hypothetical protein